MKRFMVDILLQGIDDETRIKLLPKELDVLKQWEVNGTLLASYIKDDIAGIYLVLTAKDKFDVAGKLSILPYYPYMKISIITLR
ncbi:hypothetical protein WBG78_13845 [Chryseolinea sp. T2]|uniref:hypothetical protein n=1 Tax=Chryseolinea sp. T2 TaxID=3129255 RepID=UPI0030783F2C